MIWKNNLLLLISADVNVIDVRTTLRSKLALPLRRAPVQLLLEILPRSGLSEYPALQLFCLSFTCICALFRILRI